MGDMEAEREALAQQAARFVGVEGEPDPSAVSPEQFEAAMKYGTRMGGEDFYEAALDYARTTDAQRERRAILAILAQNVDEERLEALYEEVAGEDWQGQEAWSVMQQSLENEANRDKAWELYQANFSDFVARTPEIRKPQTAGAVSSFCEAGDIAEARDFFTSNSEAIPGYERSLAQAEESANLCAAFRSEKVGELSAALNSENED